MMLFLKQALRRWLEVDSIEGLLAAKFKDAMLEREMRESAARREPVQRPEDHRLRMATTDAGNALRQALDLNWKLDAFAAALGLQIVVMADERKAVVVPHEDVKFAESVRLAALAVEELEVSRAQRRAFMLVRQIEEHVKRAETARKDPA